jgi:hypothetical protein
MDREPRATPYVSAFSVAGAQFVLDGLAWTAVRGPSHARLAKPFEVGYNNTL